MIKLVYGYGVGLLLLLVGCATPPVPHEKEPSIIVIRNATGWDLQSVSLASVPTRAGAIRRVGSVSPVPRNGSPAIVRSSSAPPLPAECELKWTDARGENFALKIALIEVLKNARGTPDEALVFQIRRDGSVLVFLEHN